MAELPKPKEEKYMIQVDARGLACPQPVIKTKKAVEGANEPVLTIVDNETAMENVIKLAKSMECEFKSYENDGNFYIEITKGEMSKDVSLKECECAECEVAGNITDKVVMIQSDKMGSGSDELGAILINSFVYTLTEAEPYPKAVLLVNSGVRLTTQNDHTIENLKILEQNGVSVISCGTCLDFFGIKDQLKVGIVGNMYDILETAKDASNTLVIG